MKQTKFIVLTILLAILMLGCTNKIDLPGTITKVENKTNNNKPTTNNVGEKKDSKATDKKSDKTDSSKPDKTTSGSDKKDEKTTGTGVVKPDDKDSETTSSGTTGESTSTTTPVKLTKLEKTKKVVNLLIPEFVKKHISKYTYENEDSGILASVNEDDNNPGKWELTINYNDINFSQELPDGDIARKEFFGNSIYFTLAHELGHILVSTKDQLTTKDDKNAGYNNDWLDWGEYYKKDSYLNMFVEKYWDSAKLQRLDELKKLRKDYSAKAKTKYEKRLENKGIRAYNKALKEASGSEENKKAIAEKARTKAIEEYKKTHKFSDSGILSTALSDAEDKFYENHKDNNEFTTAYAATSPDEDIAESLSFFVHNYWPTVKNYKIKYPKGTNETQENYEKRLKRAEIRSKYIKFKKTRFFKKINIFNNFKNEYLKNENFINKNHPELVTN